MTEVLVVEVMLTGDPASAVVVGVLLMKIVTALRAQSIQERSSVASNAIA
jgi:hypothetical protein